jgi:hypothetical protein
MSANMSLLDGEYVPTTEDILPNGDVGHLHIAMLRHGATGGPCDLLTEDLALLFQRIVQDGARPRAWPQRI